MNYIEIGSAPTEEPCAQVGSDGYAYHSQKECEAFKHQLKRAFPRGSFGVKNFSHDFGTYREVVAYLPDDDEAACEAAYEAESNTPLLWDADAKEELGI